jgi:hypothetical protein
MFDTKSDRLIEVLVHKGACDQAEATRIKLGLESAYGAPFADYHFYELLANAKRKARGELIEFAVTKAEKSALHSCMISHDPIPKLSAPDE